VSLSSDESSIDLLSDSEDSEEEEEDDEDSPPRESRGKRAEKKGKASAEMGGAKRKRDGSAMEGDEDVRVVKVRGGAVGKAKGAAGAGRASVTPAGGYSFYSDFPIQFPSPKSPKESLFHI
jgi:hypothetical protein